MLINKKIVDFIQRLSWEVEIKMLLLKKTEYLYQFEIKSLKF
jgi:hypothetical protein